MGVGVGKNDGKPVGVSVVGMSVVGPVVGAGDGRVSVGAADGASVCVADAPTSTTSCSSMYAVCESASRRPSASRRSVE